MTELFDTLRELQQNIVRNIVKILPAQQAFADLLDDNDFVNIAAAAVTYATQQSISDDQHFHFTTAIDYPFAADHFMASRYSDGTFAAWYGSLDETTTIHETVYHMIKNELAIANIHQVDEIIRHRVIYDVFCHGILIDLTHKKITHPMLIADQYTDTQTIGKQLYQQGHPGLLTPSARHASGTNVTIFKCDILKQPSVCDEMTYHLFPSLKKISVKKKNRIMIEINW